MPCNGSVWSVGQALQLLHILLIALRERMNILWSFANNNRLRGLTNPSPRLFQFHSRVQHRPANGSMVFNVLKNFFLQRETNALCHVSMRRVLSMRCKWFRNSATQHYII